MSNYGSETVLYYFSDKKLSVEEIKMYYKNIPALIEIVYSDCMTVTNLQSNVKGKGYAITLLVHASKEAVQRGIVYIELDDCSDCYRKPHNIYTKLGIEYIDVESGPEMKGYSCIVSKFPVISYLPLKIYKMVL